jgi:Subunit ChlI of Mg-chelatase
VVGLGDKAVAESRERVRAALNASGLAMPAKRITVNLAPADLPKEGSHYDLPIALGIMAAIGAIAPDSLENYTVLGETRARRNGHRGRRRAPRGYCRQCARPRPHLSACERAGGRVGRPGHRRFGAHFPNSARQSF